ncbi:MAG: hypothetical protein HUU22_12740 [Phycisphaerae bacterium]|nr:glycosyltransferase family 39 protein [Phycisphaerae bacterium]NUQ46885.1 hypothetical protein [Phycisphaerae bacterium]
MLLHSNVINRRLPTPALAFFALMLAIESAWAIRCVAMPDEMMHGTAVSVYNAAEFQHHRPIYRDWRERPHVPAIYGIFSYVVPGLIGRAVDADLLDLYVIGRLLSLIATAGIGVAIYRLARRTASGDSDGTSPMFAAAAALATLSFPIFWPVCGEFRGDAPAILCSLAALAVYRSNEQSPRRWMSPPLIVLAFLFKPSCVLAGLTIPAYLMIRRRPVEAISFFVAWAAPIAILIVLLQRATDGLYLLNAVDAFRGNRDVGNMIIWPVGVLPKAVALYAFAAAWLYAHRTGRRMDLLSVHFWMTLVVPFVLTYRDGADDYYFCEHIAAACILMAAQWETWLRGFSSPDERLVRVLICLAPALPVSAMAWSHTPPVSRMLHGVLDAREWVHGERALFRDMAKALDSLPQPVLCDADGLTLLSRSPPVLMDTWGLSGLRDQGVFDDSAIVADLAARRFGAVILRQPADVIMRYQTTVHVPSAWRQAILREYRPAGKIGDRYYLYLPQEEKEPD